MCFPVSIYLSCGILKFFQQNKKCLPAPLQFSEAGCIWPNAQSNTVHQFWSVQCTGQSDWQQTVAGLLVQSLAEVIRVGNCEISNAHGFFEGARTSGQDKELLHGELVSCARATIDHIEGWHVQDDLGVFGLVDSSRRIAWYSCPEQVFISVKVNLYGGVTMRINDLSAVDLTLDML